MLARRHSPTRLARPARRTRCNLQSAKLYQQSITHPHLKQNENTVWTDSQDYGANEISYTSKTSLFHKTTRFTSEIITLFRVPPQLFHLSAQSKISHLQNSYAYFTTTYCRNQRETHIVAIYSRKQMPASKNVTQRFDLFGLFVHKCGSVLMG